jgi:CHASE2 domain-containing sensor protein
MRKMSQFLPEQLTREEFASLKQLAMPESTELPPAKIRERLILIGYVKEVLGGLIVTDEGMLRIVMGK